MTRSAARAGEFLWDADTNYGYGEFLRRELSTQSPANWARLHQQRPAPEIGEYFKSEWLKPYVKAPPQEKMRTYAATDYAVTSKGGDYTVHLIIGVDPDWNMYVLDLWRKQTNTAEWVEKPCSNGPALEADDVGGKRAGQIRAGRRTPHREAHV